MNQSEVRMGYLLQCVEAIVMGIPQGVPAGLLFWTRKSKVKSRGKMAESPILHVFNRLTYSTDPLFSSFRTLKSRKVPNYPPNSEALLLDEDLQPINIDNFKMRRTPFRDFWLSISQWGPHLNQPPRGGPRKL